MLGLSAVRSSIALITTEEISIPVPATAFCTKRLGTQRRVSLAEPPAS